MSDAVTTLNKKKNLTASFSLKGLYILGDIYMIYLWDDVLTHLKFDKDHYFVLGSKASEISQVVCCNTYDPWEIDRITIIINDQ